MDERRRGRVDKHEYERMSQKVIGSERGRETERQREREREREETLSD